MRRASAGALVVLTLVVTLFGLAALQFAAAEEATTDSTEPQYELGGRLLTRQLDDGRIEVCFEPTDGDLQCPEKRFIRLDRAPRDRWLRSSEISWTTPIDPEQIIYPEVDIVEVGEPSCEPNIERMMAGTWKVSTVRFSGSAFYIGDGRFLTAHHVIEDQPPFVTLSQGERYIAAAVLGADKAADVALLEVYDHEKVADIPTLALRTPTQDDIGEPIYMVGYTHPGAQKVAFGDVVMRVNSDELETSGDFGPGRSTDPVFDACADVIGVAAVVNSNSTIATSARALATALEGLPISYPELPNQLPLSTQLLSDILIWHYAEDPPAGSDCIHYDVDLWMGFAGNVRDFPFDLRTYRYADTCEWGDVRIVGYDRAPRVDANAEPLFCPRVHYNGFEGESVGSVRIANLVHSSEEHFGTIKLWEYLTLPGCPTPDISHRVNLEFPIPPSDEIGENVFWPQFTLFGSEGVASVPADGTSIISRTMDDGLVERKFTGSWSSIGALEPTGIQVRTRFDTYRLSFLGPGTAEDRRGASSGVEPGIDVTSHIQVRIEGDSGVMSVCLVVPDRERLCPRVGESEQEEPANGGWKAFSSVSWKADLTPTEIRAVMNVEDTMQLGCQVSPELASAAWQFSSMEDSSTAIYVGKNEFLVRASSVPEDLPWGVVSRGESSMVVQRVAEDHRYGFALMEVVGQRNEMRIGHPVRFGDGVDEMLGEWAVLVSYPRSGSDRYMLLFDTVTEIKSRSFRFGSWLIAFGDGAPIVDPCSQELLGMLYGDGRALKSGELNSVLADLRDGKDMVGEFQRGPQLVGTAALSSRPVHITTVPPSGSELRCHIEDAENRGMTYALYAANAADPDVQVVIEGQRKRDGVCSPVGRLFFVEYQSDEAPDRVCAEPSSPESGISDLTIEFVAQEGVELLQAATFRRDACGTRGGGQERLDNWPSDYFVKVRVAESVDMDDVRVSFLDDHGRYIRVRTLRIVSYQEGWIGWRVNADGNREVAKVVVTIDD